MENFRSTKATVFLGAIERNIKKLINTYSGYKYYTAVVKADCYGYRGFKVVDAMIKGGANSLAASLLEEGLALRERYPKIPIMLFTPMGENELEICRQRKITVTVATQQQAETASKIPQLNVMIRVNGGSDIFGGPTDKKGFETLWNTLSKGECNLFGVYLHSYNAESESDTLKEYQTFENMTEDLDLNTLEMVSISNSLTLPRYGKKSYANACRLGNIIYRIESEDVSLEHTFCLSTKVLSVFDLKKGQSLAYSHAFTAQNDCKIATLPIGFGDGFSKTNIGRDVFIGEQRYRIIAVTMDVTHILIDQNVKTGDEVLLIRDNHHLDEISAHIHGATEEPICALNKRVYREYIQD